MVDSIYKRMTQEERIEAVAQAIWFKSENAFRRCVDVRLYEQQKEHWVAIAQAALAAAGVEEMVRDAANSGREHEIKRLKAELAEARLERDALWTAIGDAEHAEDCQCFIRANWDGKYDAAWCDCWLAKIYAIDAARAGGGE
jgi:hypothetical protein